MPVTITGSKYAQVALVTSTLSAGISSTDTSITLANASAFPTSGNITIGNESISYTGKTTNTLTGCTRGLDGTTAASYSTGVSVQSGNPWNIFATAATFTTTDFTVSRAVALFTSANVFRGIAYARTCPSTTQIQLISRFFDPVDGSIVQVQDGDTVLVSKNFSEIATTGVVYSSTNGKKLTVTDTVTFGTTGQQNSVFVFDDNATWDGGNFQIVLSGGVVLFGRLMDYGTREIVNPCIIYTGTGSAPSPFVNSTAVNFIQFGGSLGGGVWLYGNVTATPVAQTFVCMDTTIRTNPLSPSAGAAFASNASRQVLDSCKFLGGGILVRFGDGVIRGGTFAQIPFSSPLPDFASVFGSDAVITVTIAANPSERAVVQDAGGFPNLWRSGASVTQNVTFVNLVSAVLTSRWSGTSIAYDYRDAYTNLKASTLIAAIRDSGWTTEATATAPATNGSSQSVTLRHRTASGSTVTASRAPFTIRLRRYGFDPIEQAVPDTTYRLLGGTSAIHLTFGGFTNQIARPSLTTVANETTANAVTGVSVTNHGASPVTWQSRQWSITVTGDLSVNPSLTASLIWAHITARISSTATWGGQAGHLWHVLVDEAAGGGYESLRGVSGGAGATLKGVRVIDQSGNPFPGFVGMTDDSGSIYVPPTIGNVIVNGLQAGSRVQIYNQTTSTEIFNNVIAGTSSNYQYYNGTGITAGNTVRIRVAKMGYLPQTLLGTAAATGLSVTANQQVDSIYNSNGIDGSTVSEFTPDYPNVQMDVSDPDGVTTVQRIYAWLRYTETTTQGIDLWFDVVTPTDEVNYLIDSTKLNLKIDNTTASPVVIAGGRIYRSDAATIIAATSGSVQMDPARVYVTESGATLIANTVLSVAQTTPIHANIKQVNNYMVDGTGTDSDPWGPV